MKICVCDDEKIDGVAVKSYIESLHLPDANVKMLTPKVLQDDIKDGAFDYDIVVLDISYDNMDFNGIDLAQMINELHPYCKIIYLTNYLEYGPEVYETKHCYFVLKNNYELMLNRALEKAIRELQAEMKTDVLDVFSDGRREYIPKRDIIYIARDNRRIVIVTQDNRIVCTQSLTSVLRGVQSSLVRAHGSYIVNLAHITFWGDKEVTVSNGEKIPIGKTYEKRLRQEYLRYWSKKI